VWAIVKADPRVDAYIQSLPDWQQTICSRIRTLIHQADPQITETIKFTNRPYFVLDGNICALLAAKDHINIFIYDPTTPDPDGIINQGHDNATARGIQLDQKASLNEQAFVKLVQAVAANNRAGGWRRLQA